VRHALAVLTGIAVGVPVMAALASMTGHTAGGLPDRYVPWARAGHHIHTGFAPLRVPVQRRAEPTADLRVSIAAPPSVKRGGSYTYRIRLANRGPGTPSEITVRTILPAGVVRTGSMLPNGVGGYAGGRDATLVMRRLAPGRSATVRFSVRVRPTSRGELVARSRIAYIGGVRDRRPRDNSSRVSTHVA
jgi:hypothetical protein